MKKSICLYFQVHQSARLRRYRFFDIGKDSHYYDDFSLRSNIRRKAQKCYLPVNEILLNAINESNGKFKVAFSITGSALEQFDRYAPEVIESFRALARTGCVEFLCETYYHSLSSLANEQEFKHQVEKHKMAIREHFNLIPISFRNTELIYSDAVGAMLSDMGFNTILTEGAKHILGWKSPDFVYHNPASPSQKLLLRNWHLSDDLALRFSDRQWDKWPLTADKFVQWMKGSNGDVCNLFMDYETFGEHQSADTGILEFLKALPLEVAKDGTFEFVTPSRSAAKHKSVGPLEVEDPISWADEERDVTAWLGNELQQEAFNKLYSLQEKLSILDDNALWSDYGHLQESDHFYYMCTKFFSDGGLRKRFTPYDTPYEAFINYMNVLSDFMIRVDNAMEETK